MESVGWIARRDPNAKHIATGHGFVPNQVEIDGESMTTLQNQIALSAVAHAPAKRRDN